MAIFFIFGDYKSTSTTALKAASLAMSMPMAMLMDQSFILSEYVDFYLFMALILFIGITSYLIYWG